MFAYVIIGIELAILYLVFWVVFIREPKPCEIRAELWGRYADSDEELMANSKQKRLPSFLFADQEKLSSCLPSRVKIRAYRMARLRKRRHRLTAEHSFCSCLCHEKNAAINTYGWGAQPSGAIREAQTNQQFAERFLLLLNRTLNKLSVKIL